MLKTDAGLLDYLIQSERGVSFYQRITYMVFVIRGVTKIKNFLERNRDLREVLSKLTYFNASLTLILSIRVLSRFLENSILCSC